MNNFVDNKSIRQMVKSNRIPYYHIAKALAMFLVVMGHIIVKYDSRGYSAPSSSFIYSFHTALFMFLSGVFFQSSLKKDFKTVLIDRSRQLVLPYISWSVLFLLLVTIPNSRYDVNYCVLGFLMGGVFHSYWYIKVLFLYLVFTWLFIKLCKNKWIGCILTYLFFTFLPDFSFSCIFIPFFLSGFLLRPVIEKVDNWWWLVCLGFVLIIIYCFWQQSYSYTTNNMEVLPYIIRTLIGILMSLFIILLLKKSVGNTTSSIGLSFITEIGSFTLGIYVCHELLYSGIVGEWLSSILPYNNLAVYFVVALVVFLVSYLIVRLINKNKYLSFLFIGNKISK